MWHIYWHWNYTVFDCWIFFCKAFALGSWFTRHFKPQFDWYWKLGLDLLVRKPVTHLLDPKEVGGSLMCPSLSFKKPLQAGDTSRALGGGPRAGSSPRGAHCGNGGASAHFKVCKNGTAQTSNASRVKAVFICNNCKNERKGVSPINV